MHCWWGNSPGNLCDPRGFPFSSQTFVQASSALSSGTMLNQLFAWLSVSWEAGSSSGKTSRGEDVWLHSLICGKNTCCCFPPISILQGLNTPFTTNRQESTSGRQRSASACSKVLPSWQYRGQTGPTEGPMRPGPAPVVTLALRPGTLRRLWGGDWCDHCLHHHLLIICSSLAPNKLENSATLNF